MSTYKRRLEHFLKEIEELAQLKTSQDSNPIHDIMDSVPFKDLETALMMARMEQAPRYRRAAQ